MRIFEVRYIPKGGTFHAFDAIIEREESVQRVAIHKIKLVGDEMGVVLYELSGDVKRFRELMSDLAANFDYQINERDGSIFFYSSFRPNDLLRQLIRITDEFELFRIPPMRFEHDGHLSSTYVGTHEVFEKAMSTVPDDVTVILDRKSPYTPNREGLESQLTQQQQAILQSAIERGYYEIPRDVSCEEIGEEFGLAGATVGEHLRKAERAIMQDLVSFSAAKPNRTPIENGNSKQVRPQPF